MMHILFLVVAFTGLGYFMFAKRRVDLLTLGYISACVYFMPGFRGEVLYPIQGMYLSGIFVEIIPETYAALILVLGMLLAVAVFHDFRRQGRVSTFGDRLDTEYVTEISVWLGFLGFLMTWATMGTDVLLSVDKNRILDEINRWALIWATGALLGFVMAWQRRRWGLLAVSGFMLVAEVYVGFRSSTAMAFMAVLVIWLHDQGPCRALIRHWKIAVAGFAFASVLFTYKFLFIAVKEGDWGYVFQHLQDPEFYYAVIVQSEPFVTQGILNEVILQGYTIDASYVIEALGSLVVFAPELGLHLVTFNDLVQPDLFPQVTDSGIAANIWAQMMSAGGWPLLIVFAALFALALMWGSDLLRTANLELKATVASAFAFFAFYFHRNDLHYQITLEKRVVLYFVLCFGIAVVVRAVFRRGALTLLRQVRPAPRPGP